MHAFYAIVLSTLLLVACGTANEANEASEEQEPAEAATEGEAAADVRLQPQEVISYTERTAQGKLDNCSSVRDCPTHFAVSYPYFAGASPDDKADDKLNTLLRQLIAQQMPVDDQNAKRSMTIDEAAEVFMGAYQNYLQTSGTEVADYGWIFTAEASCSFQNQQLICLQVSMEQYSGGAHGITPAAYFVVEPGTGQEYGFEAFFEPGTEQAVLAVVRNGIRAMRKLPDVDLSTQGFFVDELPLPSSLGVLEDALVFVYNAYEIAPHNMGMFEVKVPFSSLLPYISANGPLGSLKNAAG